MSRAQRRWYDKVASFFRGTRLCGFHIAESRFAVLVSRSLVSSEGGGSYYNKYKAENFCLSRKLVNELSLFLFTKLILVKRLPHLRRSCPTFPPKRSKLLQLWPKTIQNLVRKTAPFSQVCRAERTSPEPWGSSRRLCAPCLLWHTVKCGLMINDVSSPLQPGNKYIYIYICIISWHGIEVLRIRN